jgi:hypothetical protein
MTAAIGGELLPLPPPEGGGRDSPVWIGLAITRPSTIFPPGHSDGKVSGTNTARRIRRSEPQASDHLIRNRKHDR